jgi:hypothetical protein
MTRDGLITCIDAGAGAVVAKSVNENAAARRQLDIADYAFVSDHGQARPAGSARRGDGLLNRSGLAQVNLDEWLAVLADGVSHGAARGCPVIGSITLADASSAAWIARAMAKVVPAVELNIGAPHGREARAVRQLTEADAVYDAVRVIRAAVAVPLFVKLPGQASDIVALAKAARSAGADAVGLVGRYPGFLLGQQNPHSIGSRRVHDRHQWRAHRDRRPAIPRRRRSRRRGRHRPMDRRAGDTHRTDRRGRRIPRRPRQRA